MVMIGTRVSLIIILHILPLGRILSAPQLTFISEDDSEEIQELLTRFVVKNGLGINNYTREHLADRAQQYLQEYLYARGKEQQAMAEQKVTPTKVTNLAKVVTEAPEPEEPSTPIPHTFVIKIVHHHNNGTHQIKNVTEFTSSGHFLENGMFQSLDGSPMLPLKSKIPMPMAPMPEVTLTVTGSPGDQLGVDNIEDAILEALLVAQDHASASGNSTGVSPPANATKVIKPTPKPLTQDQIVGNIWGSLAQGNLLGVLEHSVQLGEAGLVQDIIDGIDNFEWCQVIRRCNKPQRPEEDDE